MDLPVLSPKDIDDVQNFAVKNDMDFIAASFVQVKHSPPAEPGKTVDAKYPCL